MSRFRVLTRIYASLIAYTQCSTDKERQKLAKQFQLVLNHIPNMKSDFATLAVDDETLGLLITFVLHIFYLANISTYLTITQLSQSSAKARRDDISGLKEGIITFVDELFDAKLSRTKTERGWKDPVAARLLCPRRLRDEYDLNCPEYV